MKKCEERQYDALVTKQRLQNLYLSKNKMIMIEWKYTIQITRYEMETKMSWGNKYYLSFFNNTTLSYITLTLYLTIYFEILFIIFSIALNIFSTTTYIVDCLIQCIKKGTYT